MKKAVIYARYSTSRQREESIEGQVRECREYADKNDVLIVDTYIDRAKSAKTDQRPEFQRMIKGSNKKQFDYVIVWKLDRFARNRYDAAKYKMRLKRNGVALLSAKEQISDRPEGIILESMLEGMAEYYSADLSEKIKRGMKENALKCKFNGGGICIGYKVNTDRLFEIDTKTAPIVREVFTRYYDGEAIVDICADLNKRGLKNNQGKAFKKNALSWMLSNERYAGVYSHGGIKVEDGIPAIVPKELFQAVQERMERNKQAPAASKADVPFLLTTRMFCGDCGSAMIGDSGSGRGKRYHYYSCTKRKKQNKCDKKSIGKELIESIVIRETLKLLSDGKTLDHIAQTVVALFEEENYTLKTLEAHLTEKQKSIHNLLSAMEQGIVTPSTKERMLELERERQEMEAAIAREQTERPLVTKDFVLFWLSKFQDGDINDLTFCRRLIDTFVNSIFLYDDKVVITYNYKGKKKTLKLKDIKDGSDFNESAPPNFLKDRH
ncbi:MAG: recombinase family protein [Christensenella sp.]|uniref:recombinase family protein n=1 Tax=Christensenella sp. TaxID=1935934 RepID=UPI002B21B7D4|nr:recombinase family protein [Christensenella sp.]MEA5004416.1 recombinase family protein [Christensenella sp.]